MRVFADEIPGGLVAEFTMPTEAQYKAVETIDRDILALGIRSSGLRRSVFRSRKRSEPAPRRRSRATPDSQATASRGAEESGGNIDAHNASTNRPVVDQPLGASAARIQGGQEPV